MFAKKRLLIVFGLGGLLLLAVAFSPWLGRSFAQVPQPEQFALALPYSASLFDEGGTPIEEGFFDFNFAFYDAQSAGELLWSETHEHVQVTGGNFTVFLGSLTPLPEQILTGSDVWLQSAIRPSGEAEFTPLTPRQKFGLPTAAEAENHPAQTGSLSCEHTHLGESWTGGGLAGLLINTPSGNVGGAFSGKTGGVGYGVVGEQHVSGSVVGAGIAGFSNSASGYAGYFDNNGGGIGILAKSGTNYAIRGESNTSAGMFGKSTTHDGVRGESAGAGKSGVYGYNSTNGYGVFGRSVNGFGLGADGKDDSLNDTVGDLWLGGDHGEIVAPGIMDLFSNQSIFLDLDDNNDESNACFKIFNSNDDVVARTCEDGTKSAVLQTRDYDQRAVYVIESPEVWLQDFGTATLLNGQATVTFEPVFAQTINSQIDYHVQLTPLCQEPLLLFVVSKTEVGFTVKGVSLDGNPSSCGFDYTITAKRLGVEELRLEEVFAEK